MSVQSEITRIANEVGLQSGLIEQIAAALEGKAGGDSGGVKVATGTVIFDSDTSKPNAKFDLSGTFATRDERVDVFIVYNERESNTLHNANNGVWCLVDVVSEYEPYQYDLVRFKKTSDIYTFGRGSTVTQYYAPNITTAYKSKNMSMSEWAVGGGMSANFLAGQTYRYYAIGFGD